MATTSAGRIVSLDILRGVAVMAILSVNIVGMAMIESAYFYPPDYGFGSTGDRVMWALNSVLVDGRFRSLFSILFGASLTLVVSRAVAAGRKGWTVHYPRMIVLLLFGVLHYYLLWWGDILVNYALVGMIAFVFWRLDAPKLLAVAVLVLAVYYLPQTVDGMAQIAKVEAGLTPGAAPDLRAAVEEMLATPRVPAEDIAAAKAAHASIAAHFRAMTSGDAAMRPWYSLPGYGLETLGLMLIGMAGLKSGFLTASWSRRSYVLTAALCLGLDLTVHAIAAVLILRADFAPQVYYPWTHLYVNPLHPVGAIGYAALIILVFSRPGPLGERIAAVGRAAFSNYLGSTLIGTVLFFGTGLGLFGEVSRGQAWLFVPPIWALMLLWSKWWLDRFRYGPFEWVWRSLSRWQVEPLRRSPLPA